MRRLSLVLIAVIAMAMAACHAGALSPSSPVARAGGPPPVWHPQLAGVRAGAAATPMPAYGTLRLVIRWPSGPGRDLAGYHVQLIPDSTAKLVVTLADSSGTVLATTAVLRSAGQATASVSMLVQAQSNLGVSVQAFASGAGAPTGPIAQGAAAGVNIVRSQDTIVPLTMTSLFVPTIATMSEDAGPIGDQVALSGQNLAPAWAAPPIVEFSGNAASVSATVTSTATGGLVVLVPSGAVTGPVQVIADGVPSTSTALYWVASALALGAPAPPAWEPSPPPASLIAVCDEALTFQASPTWVLPAGTTAATFGTPPQPAWQPVTGAAGAFQSAEGNTDSFIAGDSEGTSSVHASLGSLMSAAESVITQQTGLFFPSSASLTGLDRIAATTVQIPYPGGGWLYDISGALDASIERASFDASGSLGSFSSYPAASLTVQREGAFAQAIGDFLYVGGGDTGGGQLGGSPGTPLQSIERASIDRTTGDLGPFSTMNAPNLVDAHDNGFSAAIGPWLYVGGGGDSSGVPGAAVERAAILDAEGDLGPFAVAGSLASATSMACSAIVGSQLFIVGGIDVSSSATTAVESAPIDAAGNLGAFALAGTTLAQAAADPGCVAIGSYLYVIGGLTGPVSSTTPALATVQRAAILANGSLGPFSIVPQVALATPRSGFLASQAIGDWFYVIGGAGTDGLSLQSIEQLALPVGGSGVLNAEIL